MTDLDIPQEELDFIKKYEEEYPEMTAEYKRLSLNQYRTFVKKSSLYGTDNIAVGSTLTTDDEKKISIVGLWYRLQDKINRIKNLVVLGKVNQVKDESVADSFSDLSVYGIIAQIVLNGKWGK